MVHLLDWIFPKRCVGCGHIGKYFCRRCSSIIRIIELNEVICPVCEKPAIDGTTHPRCQTRYTIDGLTSFFHYDGAVRQAIKSIKYRYVSDLAKEFVDLVPVESLKQIVGVCHSRACPELRREGGNPVLKIEIPAQGRNDKINAVLVPVPLHPLRRRWRGFNQAEVMGKFLAERIHIPVRTDILVRIKKTTPQVEVKDRKHRLKNMDDVFGLSPSTMNRKPLTIFLFDDVFTTGATMRAAASILKRAGASFVWGISMAR